jgi:GDP-L-fucose synthase
MKITDKILVTGASGFIGSNVLRVLYERGYRNLCASSQSRPLRNNFEGCETIEHILGDLHNEEFSNQLTQGVDVIFHCAANTSNALDTKFNPMLHVTPNIIMNTVLMEQSWKNKVKKFIFLSTANVNGDLGDVYAIEDANYMGMPLVPVYKAVGAMKRFGEMMCDFFSNQIHNPMQCIVIRPSNAYGPNDKYDFEKCHVTPANIRKVADNINPIPVWGDGTEIRDILHADDMADGIVFVAERVDTYDIYNVCYGEGFSVNQVLEWIKEADNNTNPIEYVNNRAPMIPVRLVSSKKINDLGWKPKRNIREALKDTVKWYKDHKDQFDPNSKP